MQDISCGFPVDNPEIYNIIEFDIRLCRLNYMRLSDNFMAYVMLFAGYIIKVGNYSSIPVMFKRGKK